VAKIVVFGAGDIARLAHFYFSTDSVHQVVAFTVDAPFRSADSFLDLPLVDFERVVELYPPATHHLFVALSYADESGRAGKYQGRRRWATGSSAT
jgi:hypothetical protein